ncbi:MAG TPA: peptide chain release factor N(5)-glutamine methyltransferase [Planctomycetaceae bacterium]|nr:peptide chain release factor N(5)-glutamine methyltransferase [Planctomycetaceae bacterium]
MATLADMDPNQPTSRRPPATRDASGPDAPWTVRRILEWTVGHLARHGSESPRLEAEVLLAHARCCKRIELYTHFDEAVSDDERAAMRDLVQRRAKSEPVAYLVGRREFFSLDLRVTPDVLIPRPDTETLVVELLERARGVASPRILDVGTGSGAIAVAAAVHLPSAHVTAIDLSEAALAVARSNAESHGVADRLRFLHGDLFAPLTAGEQFDLIASNPPYVRDGELESLPPDVRLHEPMSALAAGPEGLDVIERVIAGAPAFLAGGGWLLVEISPRQSAAVLRQLERQGAYAKARGVRDLRGQVRVVVAQRRA